MQVFHLPLETLSNLERDFVCAAVTTGSLRVFVPTPGRFESEDGRKGSNGRTVEIYPYQDPDRDFHPSLDLGLDLNPEGSSDGGRTRPRQALPNRRIRGSLSQTSRGGGEQCILQESFRYHCFCRGCRRYFSLPISRIQEQQKSACRSVKVRVYSPPSSEYRRHAMVAVAVDPLQAT